MSGWRAYRWVWGLATAAVIAAMLVPASGAGAQTSANDCVWAAEARRVGGEPRMGSVALGDGASWSLTQRIEAWSPDRSRVAYIGLAGGDSFGLATSRPDGTRQRLVLDFGDPRFSVSSQPIQWSPDGRKIAVIGRYLAVVGGTPQLFVVEVATGAITQVSDAPAGVIGTPAWSPDSSRLAWPQIRPTAGIVVPTPDQRDVFVGNADGTGRPTEIITTAFIPAPSYPLGTRFDPPADIDGLAFSPDGTRLAFTGWDFVGADGTGSFGDDLWVANADGSGVSQLANDEDPGGPQGYSQPTWSPDGTRLAVGIVSGTLNPPNNGVGIFDAGSGALVRTFDAGNPMSAAAWSDDGNRLAFSADRSGDAFENDIRIASVSSGSVRTVLRGFAEDLVAWVPCIAAPPTCRGRNATRIGTNRADTIRGTNRADVIVTFGGRDRVVARGGNDVICTGRGRDTVRAGAGNDWVSGGGGNDRVIGQGGNDRLRGDGGRDRVLGSAGNDRLDGGPGRDICRPGPGRDRVRRCP